MHLFLLLTSWSPSNYCPNRGVLLSSKYASSASVLTRPKTAVQASQLSPQHAAGRQAREMHRLGLRALTKVPVGVTAEFFDDFSVKYLWGKRV
jgi:hypothetical protein